MDVFAIGAVMVLPMVTIAITLYYSWKETKDIGNE